MEWAGGHIAASLAYIIDYKIYRSLIFFLLFSISREVVKCNLDSNIVYTLIEGGGGIPVPILPV